MKSKRLIAYKMMPNGDIRAYQSQAKDKRGASGKSFFDINNLAPTLVSRNEIRIFFMKPKIDVLGYYIPPNRKHPSKGVVYGIDGISPCICDYSGGGNLVPTILVVDDMKNITLKQRPNGSTMGLSINVCPTITPVLLNTIALL